MRSLVNRGTLTAILFSVATVPFALSVDVSLADDVYHIDPSSPMSFTVPQGAESLRLDYETRSGVSYLPQFVYFDTGNCDNRGENFPSPPPPYSLTITRDDSGATVGSVSGTNGPEVAVYPCDCDQGRFGGCPAPHADEHFVHPEQRQIDVRSAAASGDVRVTVVASNVSAILTVPSGAAHVFSFELPHGLEDQRVLTHKYRDDDAYPLDTLQLPMSASARPRVVVRGSVDLNGSGVSRDVFFRLIDPPDSSPYVPAQASAQDDNHDPAVRAGVLYAQDASGNYLLDANGQALRSDSTGTLKVTSRSDGAVTLVLETTDRYAGDNYQIEASFDAAFTCGASCPQSATYVAWKRVYLEIDRMFRTGSFLLKEPPTRAGHGEIYVTGLAPFASGQTVRLIHAPRYKVAVDGEKFYSETVTVDVIPPNAQTGEPGHLKIRNGGTLQRTYGRDPDFPEDVNLSDAVGVVNDDDERDYYEANFGPVDLTTDRSLVEDAFALAFVEYVSVAQDVEEVPFFPEIPDPNTLHRFSSKWAQHVTHLPAYPFFKSHDNHHQIIGAASGVRDTIMGESNSGIGRNWSYTYIDNMHKRVAEGLAPFTGLDAAIFTTENLAHEMAHLWRVNTSPIPTGGNFGHCAYASWRNDGTFCRMRVDWGGTPNSNQHNRERADGIIEFHYVVSPNRPPDSEYLQIRHAPEPTPR